MKYNKNDIYTTNNKLEVTVSQTGNVAMIREHGEDKATKRQGYRVVVDGETVGFGSWDKSERDLLLDVIKRERYAHLAYKELYYDLLRKLGSIGLVYRSEVDDEESDDRL